MYKPDKQYLFKNPEAKISDITFKGEKQMLSLRSEIR